MSGTGVDVNVLVVFCSRYGTTEKLALAAAVGALQAHANIRLRRLDDAASAETIAADPRWTENLRRMRRDYVSPRAADPLWADVIVLAAPADAAAEVQAFLTSLPPVSTGADRILAPMMAEEPEGLAPVYAAAARTGLVLVPAPAGSGDASVDARLQGRRVSHVARALKASR